MAYTKAMGSYAAPLKALFFLVLLAGGAAFFTSGNGSHSVEVTVRETYPKGQWGGSVIPASCPSYAHTSGQCAPPDFSANGRGGSGASISIIEGDSATLTWSCPSAYNSSSSGSNFSTGGAMSGSADVSPETDTTYTVVCNDSGSSANVYITVIHPVLTITASPTRVRAGNPSTISWSAQSVDSCQINRSSGGVFASGVSGAQSTGPLQNQTTYTLVCETAGGDVSESVIVTIAPTYIEI